MTRLFGPLVSFDEISKSELNTALVAWGHKMGPWTRPTWRGWFHGLRLNGELVAVIAAGDLIRPQCAGGLRRDEALEVARVCADRRYWCKVILRIWREAVFPALAREHGWGWAVSYQDADLHSGDLYRSDGWVRIAFSRSGTDHRSGRKGRNKFVWAWSVCPGARAARKMRADEPKRRVRS